MIGKELLQDIYKKTDEFWETAVELPEFVTIFAGKEIGHRVADFVDEQTVKMLDSNFKTAHELGPTGTRRARSMGDVWIYANNMHNPVNVKSGEYGRSGQPNLVSLTKLIRSLLKGEIDSYYLLFIKFERQGELLVPRIYLVDMLDYLDFVTFDAGPGQTMLRESAFFAAVSTGYQPPQLTITEKIERLLALYEDGNQRLIANRAARIKLLKEKANRYRAKGTHEIDQSELHLG